MPTFSIKYRTVQKHPKEKAMKGSELSDGSLGSKSFCAKDRFLASMSAGLDSSFSHCRSSSMALMVPKYPKVSSWWNIHPAWKLQVCRFKFVEKWLCMAVCIHRFEDSTSHTLPLLRPAVRVRHGSVQILEGHDMLLVCFCLGVSGLLGKA